jgi:hypothetical protein
MKAFDSISPEFRKELSDFVDKHAPYVIKMMMDDKATTDEAGQAHAMAVHAELKSRMKVHLSDGIILEMAADMLLGALATKTLDYLRLLKVAEKLGVPLDLLKQQGLEADLPPGLFEEEPELPGEGYADKKPRFKME